MSKELIPYEGDNSTEVYDSLLDRHKVFVEEYALTSNGARAYRKAYPEVETSTAQANSYKLLQRPDIQAACKEISKVNVERYKVKKEYIIKKLQDIIEDSKTPVSEVRKALADLARITGNVEEKTDTTERITIVMPQFLPPSNLTEDAEYKDITNE